MAKLSARGRTEVWRLEKTESRYGSDGGTTKYELVLMSDGHVLSKKTYYKEDGKVDYNSGYRIAAEFRRKVRKGQEEAVKNVLLTKGFQEAK